jgi:hypothetical protein
VEWSGEHVSLGLVNKKSVSDGYTGRKQKIIVRKIGHKKKDIEVSEEEEVMSLLGEKVLEA